MKVTVKLIKIGPLGKAELEIKGRIETVQTSIVKVGKNKGKYTGDLRRLVTQTPVKEDQLTPV